MQILIETIKQDYVEITEYSDTEERYTKGRATINFRYIKNGIKLHGEYMADTIGDLTFAQLEEKVKEYIMQEVLSD